MLTRTLTLRLGLLAGLCAGGAHAQAVPATPDAPAGAAQASVCDLIDAAAAANRLPVGFFTRLVWRESHFAAGAVSPKGAQGIAQFMPATAARRGLADPFDAPSAIAAAAAYLSDLREQFGNLGLAAAAYNAGEKRVADWLAGDSGLPEETQDYVLFITGREVAEWKSDDVDAVAAAASAVAASIIAAPARRKPAAGCADLAELLAKGAGRASVPASPVSAPWTPWGVQVAGNFSRAQALASYATLQRRFAKIIGGGPPLILRTVMAGHGRAPFYAIRLPADTRDGADALCRQLHAVGGACIVMKNAR